MEQAHPTAEQQGSGPSGLQNGSMHPPRIQSLWMRDSLLAGPSDAGGLGFKSEFLALAFAENGEVQVWCRHLAKFLHTKQLRL